MHKHFDYVQAPNGARLQASALDTVFAAALAQFASVLLASFINGDYEFISALLITVLYYALPLTINGQTLGKKIYGLRVLPFEGDRALSWREALTRETVGKGISYITLGIGFFMILWRDDRRALHDLLSKTIVVQDAAVAERRKGFFAGLAKSVAVSSVLTASSLSYFYYSSFIADRLEAQLTAQGLKVGDVSGNLAKGFRISGLEVTNETDRVNFGTIDISFSDYTKIFSERTLTLNSVSFTNAEMTIKGGSGEGLLIGLLAMPFISQDEADDQGKSPKQRHQFKKIVLSSLTAENIKILDPSKTVEVRSIQLSEVVVEPLTMNVSWNSLKVRSSFADLDTGKVRFNKAEVDLSSPLTARLYQVPGVKLLKPIDLVAAFSFSKGKFENVQVNALENKITLTAQSGKNYQLWVSALSPTDYLENLPFDKISFYSSKTSPFELVTGSPQTASFEIGTAKFIYQDQPASPADPTSIFAAMLGSRIEAYHQAADAQYSLKLPPGFLSTLVMGGGKIELSSSQNLSPEEILYRLGAKNSQAISKFFVTPLRFPATQPTTQPTTQPATQ